MHRASVYLPAKPSAAALPKRPVKGPPHAGAAVRRCLPRRSPSFRGRNGTVMACPLGLSTTEKEGVMHAYASQRYPSGCCGHLIRRRFLLAGIDLRRGFCGRCIAARSGFFRRTRSQVLNERVKTGHLWAPQNRPFPTARDWSRDLLHGVLCWQGVCRRASRHARSLWAARQPLQYRQIQIADLLGQLRSRGAGQRFRQRVPPLPVLFLQLQERLHGVVPLLWPRLRSAGRRYRIRDSPALRRSR